MRGNKICKYRKQNQLHNGEIFRHVQAGKLVGGEAIRHALGGLGHRGVAGVRQGKLIELDLDATDSAAAKAEVEKMCEGLLANTVIEKYSVEIV